MQLCLVFQALGDGVIFNVSILISHHCGFCKRYICTACRVELGEKKNILLSILILSKTILESIQIEENRFLNKPEVKVSLSASILEI